MDAQPKVVELGRATNRGPVILLLPADPCLERLAGMKGGSGVQKFWQKVEDMVELVCTIVLLYWKCARPTRNQVALFSVK